MKKKILFICDWPESVKNREVLQALLDNNFSENYEWKVWSCKKGSNNKLIYRWYCYTKGALFALKYRKSYYAIFMWQQMVGYILFEILRTIHFKMPKIVIYTYIYNSESFLRHFKKHLIVNALKQSQGVIWPSIEMKNEVKRDFPKFEFKNFSSVNPILDVIDGEIQVEKELDDPVFRNGIFTAGRSERDFNIVIKAFRNTDIPVTIVCPDNYPITETNITSNIRILYFSQVSHEQYYALAGQAFCILISVKSESSPCGQLLVNFAFENSIPVIATDSYGVKDYLENNVNGVLFKLGQSDEIIKGYKKLKNDETFRKKITHNAKITAKQMAPSPFVKKIIAIIEDVHSD